MINKKVILEISKSKDVEITGAALFQARVDAGLGRGTLARKMNAEGFNSWYKVGIWRHERNRKGKFTLTPGEFQALRTVLGAEVKIITE